MKRQDKEPRMIRFQAVEKILGSLFTVARFFMVWSSTLPKLCTSLIKNRGHAYLFTYKNNDKIVPEQSVWGGLRNELGMKQQEKACREKKHLLSPQAEASSFL